MAGDSTQFLIDMAAKLTGGDASVATLGELGDRMLAAGSTAKDLEGAVGRASAALKESAAASKLASDAVSAGETSYGQAETAADRAAKAIEKIGLAVESQKGKLKAAFEAGDFSSAEKASAKLYALVERQGEIATKSAAATAALKSEAVALDAVKTTAAAAASQEKAIAAGLKNVQSAAEKAGKAEALAAGSGKVNETAEALGKLGGPLGIAGQKAFGFATGWQKLTSSLGSAGPYVAIAVAIVAIASAIGFATVATASWAVSLADANRTQTLLTAGVARSVAGGEQLEGTIAKLGGIVPQTNDELLSMAKGLADSGLRGKELSTALEQAAVKAAQLKWGPDFQKQLLSLDNQSKRFGNNLADTFGGLKIEGLLTGIQTLVALLDSSTESGRALKFLFEALFQPVIDGASAALPKVERLFLYAEILALKAYIALKPYSSQLKLLGEVLLIGVAAIIGVFAVAIGAVVVGIGVLIAQTGAVIYAVVQFGIAFWNSAVAIGEAIGKTIESFLGLGAALFGALGSAVAWVSDLGTQMINGLVNGITGGATAVVNAMKGVVSGAIDAAKHALGIASPSKVFADIGGNTAAGFSEGVDGGSGDAQGSLEALVAPPKGAAAGAGGRGGGIGDVSVTFIIQDADKKSSGDLIAEIEESMTSFFENLAGSIGGGEAAASA